MVIDADDAGGLEQEIPELARSKRACVTKYRHPNPKLCHRRIRAL